MKTIYLQICFFTRTILRITIFALINLIIKRDEHIVLFGCRKARKIDMFTFNTKYLYLNQNKIKDLKLVWLCDDKNIVRELKQNGFKNIYGRKSIQGLYYSLKAGFWVTDNDVEGVNNSMFSFGATVINVWHGIPLKKIESDIDSRPKFPYLINLIYRFLKKKDDFYIANSEYDQEHFQTAFCTIKDKIKILGSPRLDVILKDIDKSYIFMNKDFNMIKHFKENSKKVFIYMPTFRDTGKDISGWLKSNKIKDFLKENNVIIVCKMHFNDASVLNSIVGDEFYIMHKDSDVYPVLKYSDALITDYSSINFDYLFVDKPIIYFVPDLKEYQEQCRGFYTPYEEFTMGEVAKNEKELLVAMHSVIYGADRYDEQRKKLLNKMFKYQDGNNCERFFELVRSIGRSNGST